MSLCFSNHALDLLHMYSLVEFPHRLRGYDQDFSHVSHFSDVMSSGDGVFGPRQAGLQGRSTMDLGRS